MRTGALRKTTAANLQYILFSDFVLIIAYVDIIAHFDLFEKVVFLLL